MFVLGPMGPKGADSGRADGGQRRAAGRGGRRAAAGAGRRAPSSEAPFINTWDRRRSFRNRRAFQVQANACVCSAKFESTFKLFFGRGVPKSILIRSGSISEVRTHTYCKIAKNFETNPMGPVPGSEIQMY